MAAKTQAVAHLTTKEEYSMLLPRLERSIAALSDLGAEPPGLPPLAVQN